MAGRQAKAGVKKTKAEIMETFKKRHPGRLAEISREYRERDRTKARAIEHKYRKKYHTDSNIKTRLLLRSRLLGALKGAVRSQSMMDLIGCSIVECRAHLEKQFTEGMSWKNQGKWHIDHKRPCASFDLTDPEQQKICFHYTNLQPLWAKDNQIKKDKYGVID